MSAIKKNKIILGLAYSMGRLLLNNPLQLPGVRHLRENGLNPSPQIGTLEIIKYVGIVLMVPHTFEVNGSEFSLTIFLQRSGNNAGRFAI